MRFKLLSLYCNPKELTSSKQSKAVKMAIYSRAVLVLIGCILQSLLCFLAGKGGQTLSDQNVHFVHVFHYPNQIYLISEFL